MSPIGPVTPGGGGGAVDSVFGRAGVVVAESGDYDAAEVGALADNASVGGDLSGTVPDPTVAKIGGIDVSLASGATGDVLTRQASGAFAPQANPSAPVSSVFTRTGAVVAEAGDYTAADVGALADDAAVGGDLSGTVPDPTVAKIGGVAVSLAGGATGDVLAQQSDGAFAPQANPSAPVSSVFTRTGAVVAEAGDYTAADVGALSAFETQSTYAWSGDVVVPSGATGYMPPFFEPVLTGTTKKLIGVRYAIRAGTSVTFEVTQNGTAVSGLSGLSATTTTAYTAATGSPSVADGDEFAVVVTAISGTPDGFASSIVFETLT